MSEENVELGRRAVEAFNRGGFDAVDGEFWRDDILWDTRPAGVPGIDAYRGREAVRRFFEEDWFATFNFDEWQVETDELIDCGGDRVLMGGRQVGRGTSSRAPVELRFFQLCTIRNGQVAQIELFLDRGKALRAAGLSE